MIAAKALGLTLIRVERQSIGKESGIIVIPRRRSILANQKRGQVRWLVKLDHHLVIMIRYVSFLLFFRRSTLVSVRYEASIFFFIFLLCLGERNSAKSRSENLIVKWKNLSNCNHENQTFNENKCFEKYWTEKTSKLRIVCVKSSFCRYLNVSST